MTLLTANDLIVHFPIRSRGLFPKVIGQVRAVDGVSFGISAGETLGLVGESGCGKSTTGRALLRLVQPTGGSVTFDGTDVTNLDAKDLRNVRRSTAMIFQDPYTALNPRHTVGTIIGAPFAVQKINPPGGVRQAVQDLMARVGLNPEHYNRYPAEFSGGQRQRIGIARAVALRPKLIVCDEPVSALDVSIQAQVINLLKDLQAEFNIAYLFIAHDLSVIRQVSDRVAVMYLGHIVEQASRDELFAHPMHPYTNALLSAIPIPDPEAQRERARITLNGDLPSPANPPSGCVFHTRCFVAQDRCRTEKPPLVEVSAGHSLACFFPITDIKPGVHIEGPNSGLVEPLRTTWEIPSEVLADEGEFGNGGPDTPGELLAPETGD